MDCKVGKLSFSDKGEGSWHLVNKRKSKIVPYGQAKLSEEKEKVGGLEPMSV